MFELIRNKNVLRWRKYMFGKSNGRTDTDDISQFYLFFVGDWSLEFILLATHDIIKIIC